MYYVPRKRPNLQARFRVFSNASKRAAVKKRKERRESVKELSPHHVDSVGNIPSISVWAAACRQLGPIVLTEAAFTSPGTRFLVISVWDVRTFCTRVQFFLNPGGSYDDAEYAALIKTYGTNGMLQLYIDPLDVQSNTDSVIWKRIKNGWTCQLAKGPL